MAKTEKTEKQQAPEKSAASQQLEHEKALLEGQKKEPESPDALYQARIKESRKALEKPLPEGMAFFEAPDGYVIVGEDSRDNIPHRLPNGDRIRVNRRRTA